MTENERDVLIQLATTVPKLDKDKQSYILGVVEGMAIAKEGSEENENENE